jgi:hypothetical protein
MSNQYQQNVPSPTRSRSGGSQGGQKRSNGRLGASPYSPESMLTKHQHLDITQTHMAPGIDDTQSELYRDYDRCGRIQNAFMQRAAFAGIKNLNSASFRNDSPL